MNHPIVIEFTPEGIVHVLGDHYFLVPAGGVRCRRASHVLPAGRRMRIAFLILRFVFGEDGRVARWTRRWPGPWTARLVVDGATFTHPSRDECIAWEIRELSRRELANLP